MEGIFLKLLNMSIAASWLVLAIVVIRLLFKKAPKAIWCILWALVGIRLLFPFSIESVVSLVPSAETVPQNIIFSNTPTIQSGLPMLNQVVNPILSQSFAPVAGDSVNPMQVIVSVASVVWVVGMVVMLLYTFISYLHIHGKIREAVEWKENIRLCDRIATPFILGIVRPKIFLPASMQEMDMEYVIAHEKAHLKRRDHWWKPLGFALLSVYWFNPAMWVAYILLCRDIELACDEKVIQTLGMESKKSYSAALINCSVPRRMIAACPLAFGEVGIKERVKSVLHYKKPAFWVTIVAVILCITIAVCFLTNPQSEQNSDLKGLSVEIVAMDLSGPAPYIEVKWRNHTFKELTCGEAFYIYREENGDWVDCRITEDYIVHTIGYSIPIMGTFQKKYYLHDLDLSEPGKYRFESNCSTTYEAVGGLQTYHVWQEFALQDGMPVTAYKQFKATELVYACGIYSFVQTADATPSYRLGNHMWLQEIGLDGKILDLGPMREITLTYETFDSRLEIGEIWFGDVSASQLRNNNKRAWELCYQPDENNTILYLLLEQKDGTFYLGYGYYGVDGELIRWLYELECTTVPTGELTER